MPARDFSFLVAGVALLREGVRMDLATWLPGLALLGLAALGLMFLFVAACAKI
jgi:hypothetical protein